MADNEDRVEAARALLEKMTNVFGSRADLETLAVKMTRLHRTLVQSFTSGFVVPFVREMARMRREERYDLRDKAACDACLAMAEALEKKYDVGESDDIGLPLI